MSDVPEERKPRRTKPPDQRKIKSRFAKSRVWSLLLLIAALASGAGCAKIAEPLPPEARIPKPATDLRAFQLANSVVLTVSRPVLNTNGSAATTLRKMQVLRLTEDANESQDGKPLSQEQFLKRADPILTISAADFSGYLNGEVFAMEDSFSSAQESMMYSSVFSYAVLFANDKNQAAGLSNQVRIAPLPIPPAPDGLSAEVTETAVRLRWVAPSRNMDGSVPAHIAGYEIYRSEEPDKIAPKAMNSERVEKPEYEDHGFQFDKTYYYAVRTVGSFENPYAESLPSKIMAVTPRDVFPPAPPENFNAVWEGSSVVLLWAPSSSADVAGYRLRRQEKGTSTSRLLQKELITKLSYRDSNVEPDRSYEYTIQAVDMHGNTSPVVRTILEIR